ncbi:hypothetical protein PENSTE_c026G03062 [Penicillium steckii]|uniref:AA1-like domain-containing protein n=1 Tax=Penicillium steckii TaxID=303698 RepID=A0A1V6SQC5_9EURO|nr:hypothetical protein PENSTE_c026G03062 [Penicillium steckii]
MNHKILLVLITVAVAVAETSVVSLFLPDINDSPQSLVGSIMAEENETAIYSINCAKTVDINDCAFYPGMLYTAGPTTVEWRIKPPYTHGLVTAICSVDGTTSAVCTISMSVTGDITPYPETTTLDKNQIQSTRVTITAAPTRSATDASVTKTEDSSQDHQRWGL